MTAGSASSIRSIEFFGLPGSGKTRISRELMRLMRANDLCVSFSGDWMGDGKHATWRTLRRLRLVLGEAPRHFGNLYRGARLIWSRSEGVADGLHSLWNFLSVEAMASRQLRGHGILVLDQGLVQAIWSARMRETQDGPAAGWHALVEDAWLGQCLFVQVECSLDVAIERLAARKARTSRMQRPGQLQELALWSRGAALVTELGEMLETGLRHRSLANRRVAIRTGSDVSSDVLARILFEHIRSAGLDVAPFPAVEADKPKIRQANGATGRA